MTTTRIQEKTGLGAAKRARLEARITLDQKELFQRAAALMGRTMTDFVVSSAQEIAARTVREHEAMTLGARDRERFVGALLEAPQPGTRLRRAARRYKDAMDR
ncbi:MAG: DUF1778 domain-containing protein [Kiloniellaceae bacterium]